MRKVGDKEPGYEGHCVIPCSCIEARASQAAWALLLINRNRRGAGSVSVYKRAYEIEPKNSSEGLSNTVVFKSVRSHVETIAIV